MIEHYTTSVAPLCFQKGSELTFWFKNLKFRTVSTKRMWSCKSDMVTDGHRKLLENMEWLHEEEFLIRYHYGRN